MPDTKADPTRHLTPVPGDLASAIRSLELLMTNALTDIQKNVALMVGTADSLTLQFQALEQRVTALETSVVAPPPPPKIERVQKALAELRAAVDDCSVPTSSVPDLARATNAD